MKCTSLYGLSRVSYCTYTSIHIDFGFHNSVELFLCRVEKYVGTILYNCTIQCELRVTIHTTYIILCIPGTSSLVKRSRIYHLPANDRSQGARQSLYHNAASAGVCGCNSCCSNVVITMSSGSFGVMGGNGYSASTMPLSPKNCGDGTSPLLWDQIEGEAATGRPK